MTSNRWDLFADPGSMDSPETGDTGAKGGDSDEGVDGRYVHFSRMHMLLITCK